MTTTISVAMATYNGAKHIIQQVDSLLRQTTPPDELVITDDCSSDATLDLVREHLAGSPCPVRIFQNDRRLGYGRNFLQAAMLCRNEYVAFCDQDDVWREDKIQSIQEAIRDSKPDLVIHGARVVDDQLRDLGTDFPVVPPGPIDLATYRNFFVPGFAITVRRSRLVAWGAESVVADAGLVDFEHDLWICMQARKDGSCLGIEKNLAFYRQHDNNTLGLAKLIHSERHRTH